MNPAVSSCWVVGEYANRVISPHDAQKLHSGITVVSPTFIYD